MKPVHVLLISILVLAATCEDSSPERQLSSVFAIPIDLGSDPIAGLKNALMSGSDSRNPIEMMMRPRRNNFSLLSDIKHELEEAMKAENPSKMKVVNFQSAVNSHQVNGQKPVVNGFASGLSMENLPDGEVVIEKFEQPIGQAAQAGNDKRKLQSRLQIEPAINLATLGKDQPVRSQKDCLNDLLSGLGVQVNQPRTPQVVFPQAQAPADPLGLFGGLTGGNQAQGGNPLEFLDQLLGGLGNLRGMASKLPTNEIDESAVNPLDFILGGGATAPKAAISTKRAVHVRRQKHVSQQTKLSKFLGGILGGGAPGAKVITINAQPTGVLPPRPQLNSLGLHSGVSNLLSMLEGSEKERLVSPVNEPEIDPISQILGGDEDLANPSAKDQVTSLSDLIASASMPPIPKKRRVRHHRKRITAIFNIPQKKKVVRIIPPPRPFYLPLMNNFYHIRGIRQSARPLVFPPLGHKKATLDRIRNNVFRFRKRHAALGAGRFGSAGHHIRASVSHHSDGLLDSGEGHHVTNVNIHHQSGGQGFAGQDVEHHTLVRVHSHHGRRGRGHHRRHHRHHRGQSSVRHRQEVLLRSRMNDFVNDLVSRNREGGCDENRIVV